MKKVTVHTKETISQTVAPLHSSSNRPTRPEPVIKIQPSYQSTSPISHAPLDPPKAESGISNALNGQLPLGSPATGSTTIQVLPMKHAQPHRHMHIKPAGKANQLNGQIDRFAAKYAEQMGLSSADFAHPSQTSQENVLLIGRIVSDNDEKMTEASVQLETSRSGGGGTRIPLDLSHCPSFSLFPGQLTCLEGKNPDGASFIVASQKRPSTGLAPKLPVGEDKFGKSPVSLLVACGPYSLDNGSLDFAPLDKLLLLAMEIKPDLLLLMGPYVDADNGAVKTGSLPDFPETIFKNQFLAKLQIFSQRCPETKLGLVPSYQELGHDFIFPQCALQPAFIGDLHKSVLLLPNPGIIFVNEFSIAVSSADILLKLGLTELSKNAPTADRFTRLSSHLLEQSSFYPVSPSAEGTNIDYNHLEALEMPFRPNLVISPSALRHFAKSVPGEDTVVVNPGQFCRKQALGSAALVTVLQPNIKPTANQVDFASRCRVDIIQF